MSGIILERLSNRKLVTIAIVLLLLQITAFLLGGTIAPQPNNAQSILSTKCTNHGKDKTRWFTNRGVGKCVAINNWDEQRVKDEHLTTNNIVFSAMFPNPRDGQELVMDRSFQHITGVLQISTEVDKDHILKENAVLTMDVRLGYKNSGDKDWTEIIRSTEYRTLDCDAGEVVDAEANRQSVNCNIMSFFELGSSHHEKYLVNLRLPVDEKSSTNLDLGEIQDITLVAIHQNGGFTKVWLSIKTVMFPAVLCVLIWNWRRVRQLDRSPSFDMPWMLLLSDIRQGLFYTALFCFWIVFAGEHIMEKGPVSTLYTYWRHLAIVGVCCVLMLIFDLCDRGVQLNNPFYTVWATETGTILSLIFIGLSACVYFLLLCYLIVRVFRNISAKKAALPHMSKPKRKFYAGVIYRFKFLMLFTLACVALTVIFFILGQVDEGAQNYDDEPRLQYTSAFFTGVYGMWNLYVISLLILYAPSHKGLVSVAYEDEVTEDSAEVLEFTNMPSSSQQNETSALTSFIAKAATD